MIGFKESLVSICIPAYKQTHFLEKNLKSILTQDYEHYEVIVTDDTPDDSVKNLVDQYVLQFKGKLKYYKNNRSLGSPENWNEAIRKSSGEYIKILHHDDWFSFPDSLSKIMSSVLLSKCDWAFCGTNIVYHNSGKSSINLPLAEEVEAIQAAPSNLIFGNIIGSPSTILVRREIKEQFDTQLKWLVDVDYYVRLLKMKYKLYYINEPLISTITEADHTVTKGAASDVNVELFENVYLLNKFSARGLDFFKLMKHFTWMSRKYNDEMPVFTRQFSDIIPYYLKIAFLTDGVNPKITDKILQILHQISKKGSKWPG